MVVVEWVYGDNGKIVEMVVHEGTDDARDIRYGESTLPGGGVSIGRKLRKSDFQGSIGRQLQEEGLVETAKRFVESGLGYARNKFLKTDIQDRGDIGGRDYTFGNRNGSNANGTLRDGDRNQKSLMDEPQVVAFHSATPQERKIPTLCALVADIAKEKRVLVVDWNFDAPQLGFVFGGEEHQGYVEAIAQNRFGNRWDAKSIKSDLQSRILKDGNVSFLPAGDVSPQSYWEAISSHAFNRLFYFGRYSISNLSTKTFPMDNLNINVDCFSNDLKSLAGMGFDYIFVDAHGATEKTAAIPLTMWSNKVAHFTSDDKAGTHYTAAIYMALARNSSEKAGNFYPVVQCIDGGCGAVEFEKRVNDRVQEVLGKSGSPLPAGNFIFTNDKQELVSRLDSIITAPHYAAR